MINIFLERFNELLNEKFDGNKAKLSKVSGIPASTLTQYFPPRSSAPSARHVVLLASAFDCSADFLLGLEDELKNVTVSAGQLTDQLPNDEQRLLYTYRKLDKIDKDKLIDDAEYFARRSNQNSNLKNRIR